MIFRSNWARLGWCWVRRQKEEEEEEEEEGEEDLPPINLLFIEFIQHLAKAVKENEQGSGRGGDFPTLRIYSKIGMNTVSTSSSSSYDMDIYSKIGMNEKWAQGGLGTDLIMNKCVTS